MEKRVQLIKQYGMTSRNWTSPSNETVIIKSVELEMTDGVDTFVAEANDKLAEQLNAQPLMEGCYLGIQAQIKVRRWNNKDGVEMRSNTIKITSLNIV